MTEIVYYVYETVNIINYKRYIGVTKNPIYTGYIGSGSIITKAIKKYTKGMFVRRDLFQGTRDEASYMEKYYIALENAVQNDRFYNIKPGGLDNFDRTNIEFTQTLSEAITNKWKDPVYREKSMNSMKSRDNTKLRATKKLQSEMGLMSGENNGMYGRKQTKESIDKGQTTRKENFMKLSKEDQEMKTKKQSDVAKSNIQNNSVMMGPKTANQKSKNRWVMIKKSFVKEPVIHKDIRMMHDFYKISEKMNELSPELKLEYLKFRFKFLEEELNEGLSAIENKDSEEVVDSLIDLIVVAMGTLDLYGVDFKKSWYSVLEANMNKEVGIKASRPNPWGLPDLIKPKNWQAPSHAGNHGSLSEIFPKEESDNE